MQKHGYIVGTQIVANIQQVAQADKPNELVLAARWAGQKLQQGRKKDPCLGRNSPKASQTWCPKRKGRGTVGLIDIFKCPR